MVSLFSLLPKDIQVSLRSQDASQTQATATAIVDTGDEQNLGKENEEQPFTYTEAEERAVVRKIDFTLLPILTILYLLSFLDRSNIGNARIEGLVKDLHINDYPSLLTIYFVGYVIFEVPANLVLKKTNPTFWLPTLALTWGIVSVCMGLVHNQASMFAARFFLGVTEAGIFCGTTLTFSFFYKRNERTTRVAFYFGAAAASGAFGGILAYGLSQLRGIGGKPGWAWIFIIEGLLTIVVAFIAYYLVPNHPHLSSKFTSREKKIIASRMRTDSDALDVEEFQWSEVKRALQSPTAYGYCMLFHGYSFGLYTLSLFLPSIIQGLGFQSWEAQLLSTPPYVVAFIVTMIVAYATQHVNLRSPFIIGSAFVAIIGYIVLITSHTVAGKYIAVFLCAAGVYSGNAVLLAWPSENCMGQTYRATVLGMQIAIGNIGAIIGTQLYRVPLGSVNNGAYRVSFGLTIVWLAIAMITAVFMYIGLARANTKTLAARQKDAESGQDSQTTSDAGSGFKADSGLWRKDFLYQL